MFKKILLSAFIVVITLILAYVGYRIIMNYQIGYEKIAPNIKDEITEVINKSKGEFPNIQTDNWNVEWIEDTQNDQIDMMDKVLDSLKPIGESKKGRPTYFIYATYDNGNLHIYIDYNKKMPYNHIVIEINKHYYIAKANKDDVNEVIAYMKRNVLRSFN